MTSPAPRLAARPDWRVTAEGTLFAGVTFELGTIEASCSYSVDEDWVTGPVWAVGRRDELARSIVNDWPGLTALEHALAEGMGVGVLAAVLKASEVQTTVRAIADTLRSAAQAYFAHGEAPAQARWAHVVKLAEALHAA